MILTSFSSVRNHGITLIPALLLLFSNQTWGSTLNGAVLNLNWCLPFTGLLLTIALAPLLSGQLWHHHAGKIIALWIITLLIPFYCRFGSFSSLNLISHALIQEYIPFLILLTALYTIAGGIAIRSNLPHTALNNTLLLLVSTILAGFIGTTGASMLMIRPLLQLNRQRRQRAYIVVFFILLVGNIGGGLTPLGDPPLFLGFLKGVEFGWTIRHMLAPVCLNSFILLSIFYWLDRYHLYRHPPQAQQTDSRFQCHIDGQCNLLLLLAVIAVILASGLWSSEHSWPVLGQKITLNALIRDGLLILLTLISLITTPAGLRQSQHFNWQSMIEIAKLFSGIFITIAPVIAILQAGTAGHLHSLITLTHNQQGEPVNLMYFWLSGLLSGFLDNAPTYLVFFNMAGGNASQLMHTMPATLLAISMGSVFMGALTYIGNAPNLMIKAIAEQQHINMPNFFGYMVWSLSLLLPVFILDSLIFLT